MNVKNHFARTLNKQKLGPSVHQYLLPYKMPTILRAVSYNGDRDVIYHDFNHHVLASLASNTERRNYDYHHNRNNLEELPTRQDPRKKRKRDEDSPVSFVSSKPLLVHESLAAKELNSKNPIDFHITKAKNSSSFHVGSGRPMRSDEQLVAERMISCSISPKNDFLLDNKGQLRTQSTSLTSVESNDSFVDSEIRLGSSKDSTYSSPLTVPNKGFRSGYGHPEWHFNHQYLNVSRTASPNHFSPLFFGSDEEIDYNPNISMATDQSLKSNSKDMEDFPYFSPFKDDGKSDFKQSDTLCHSLQTSPIPNKKMNDNSFNEIDGFDKNIDDFADMFADRSEAHILSGFDTKNNGKITDSTEHDGSEEPDRANPASVIASTNYNATTADHSPQLPRNTLKPSILKISETSAFAPYRKLSMKTTKATEIKNTTGPMKNHQYYKHIQSALKHLPSRLVKIKLLFDSAVDVIKSNMNVNQKDKRDIEAVASLLTDLRPRPDPRGLANDSPRSSKTHSTNTSPTPVSNIGAIPSMQSNVETTCSETAMDTSGELSTGIVI